MLLYVVKVTVAICTSQSRIQLNFPPKSKKLDWASSHNSYFDEFTGDTDYQIITIIFIYSLIALSISLIHDIRLVTIVFFEFPERTQTRKNVHINCARCKTTQQPCIDVSSAQHVFFKPFTPHKYQKQLEMTTWASQIYIPKCFFWPSFRKTASFLLAAQDYMNSMKKQYTRCPTQTHTRSLNANDIAWSSRTRVRYTKPSSKPAHSDGEKLGCTSEHNSGHSVNRKGIACCPFSSCGAE